ncbi:MAG TPA: hypothetical protein VGK32_00790 [Vicinamibacterales bacterium]|jgi:hypothetical protein
MIEVGALAAYVGAAWIIALLGSNRRFGFWGYFFGSLLLTPFIGLLLYLATDGPVRPRTKAETLK